MLRPLLTELKQGLPLRMHQSFFNELAQQIKFIFSTAKETLQKQTKNVYRVHETEKKTKSVPHSVTSQVWGLRQSPQLKEQICDNTRMVEDFRRWWYGAMAGWWLVREHGPKPTPVPVFLSYISHEVTQDCTWGFAERSLRNNTLQSVEDHLPSAVTYLLFTSSLSMRSEQNLYDK